jgi:translation initiation factor 1
MADHSGSRLVYSTDGTELPSAKASKGGGAEPPAPHNRKLTPAPAAITGVPNDGIVRIMRDRKGRGGKIASTITGLPGDETALDAILKDLKQTCGAGGSREGRVLIVQGDHRTRLQSVLESRGFKIKLAGG